jgi:hypothetical protein
MDYGVDNSIVTGPAPTRRRGTGCPEPPPRRQAHRGSARAGRDSLGVGKAEPRPTGAGLQNGCTLAYATAQLAAAALCLGVPAQSWLPSPRERAVHAVPCRARAVGGAAYGFSCWGRGRRACPARSTQRPTLQRTARQMLLYLLQCNGRPNG